MILEAPGIIGTEEICEKITVAAIRAEFRHSLRLLVGYGLIDHAALDAGRPLALDNAARPLSLECRSRICSASIGATAYAGGPFRCLNSSARNYLKFRSCHANARCSSACGPFPEASPAKQRARQPALGRRCHASAAPPPPWAKALAETARMNATPIAKTLPLLIICIGVFSPEDKRPLGTQFCNICGFSISLRTGALFRAQELAETDFTPLAGRRGLGD
jgi:hypothetical protein